MNFALATEAHGNIDEIENRITQALKEVGFGILTRIEVDKVLKEKIGVDTPPYRILGACNPKLAHQALEVKPEIGVFLPCSVCLKQVSDNTVAMWALDPGMIVQNLGDPALSPHGEQAKQQFEQALHSVK